MVTATVAGAVLAVVAALRAARRSGTHAKVAARLQAVRPATRSRPQWVKAPARVRARLDSAGVPIDADRIWTAWCVGTAALGAIAGWTAGPGLAAVVAGAMVGGPAVALATASGRRDAAYERALPDALEAVARSLRSGATLPGAVAEAGREVPGAVGADLASTAAATSGGVRFVDALDAWSSRRPLRGVELAVVALALAAATGGTSARAVDGVAATLRERVAVAAEARALASQARASALVITLAPLAFAALAAAADPQNARFLLRTSLGLLFLSSGLTLDALAALWMARLTRVAS
jgi:tight adherence protein B